jgi:hypothetical protein
MVRQLVLVFHFLWICLGTTTVFAQVKPEVIERGKRATVLVEVVTDKGQATGSAFCIDKTGLFVTNAHVIGGAGVGDRIQLVLDIGRKTRRTLPAEPLWIDEELDLALLKARPRGGPLVDLNLGKDSDLKEGDEITTFGFPFGKQLAVDERDYTEVSVNLSRVTLLRKELNRLGSIKFDGQLNPGNSGGPVLRPRGQVVGVAASTVVGGGVNYAIPVGKLSERLGRPGLQALIPPLDYHDRSRTVTWTFRLVAPWPSGELPEGLNVVLKLNPNVGEPRTIACKSSGNDTYSATFTPVPRDRTRLMRLNILTGDRSGRWVAAEVKDCDVAVGERRFMLGDLRSIFFNPGFNQGPYVILAKAEKVDGAIRGLGTVTESRNFELWLVRWGVDSVASRGNVIAVGIDNAGLVHIRTRDDNGRLVADTDEKKQPATHAAAFASLKQKLPGLMPPHPLSTAERNQVLAEVFSIIGRPHARKIDLARCQRVDVQGYVDGLPNVHAINATAELTCGGITLATAHRNLDFSIVPAITAVTVRGDFVASRPPGFNPNRAQVKLLDDEGMVTIGGKLNVDGTPRGAYKAIRPPELPASPGGAVVRALEGKIDDLAVGGGGRYLLLVLKVARKLAVFDTNAAKVVKTIPLPTENVLVAAGARKFVVAFPDEKLLQRWDLETLTSDGGFLPSSIKEDLKAIVMGSDSDGPILAHWSPVRPSYGPNRLSFIDLDSLHVLTVGPVSGGRCEVSPSRGSFTGGGEIRVSPGGGLFGLWTGNSSRQGLCTLTVRGGSLGYYKEDVHACGFASPGADGVTIFTGVLGRLDAFGKPVGGPSHPSSTRNWDINRPWEYRGWDGKSPWELLTVPTADPAYYLVLEQAPFWRYRSYDPTGAVTASLHSSGDATRLLTIPALAEMTGFKVEDWYSGRLGVDNRFHYVPAARLLITIPPTNDRLVLRRVETEPAIAQTGAIVVLSQPLVNAVAGRPLHMRVIAKSSAGQVKFTLAEGPKGLSVSPDGQISWQQPVQSDGEPLEMVLSLSDPAGRKRTYKMVIRVQ